MTSLEEQETIINFNQAEDVAYIYTASPVVWKELKRRGFNPTKVHRHSWGISGMDFEVPKKLIRLPRPYQPKTPAQRAASRKSIQKARLFNPKLAKLTENPDPSSPTHSKLPAHQQNPNQPQTIP